MKTAILALVTFSTIFSSSAFAKDYAIDPTIIAVLMNNCPTGSPTAGSSLHADQTQYAMLAFYATTNAPGVNEFGAAANGLSYQVVNNQFILTKKGGVLGHDTSLVLGTPVVDGCFAPGYVDHDKITLSRNVKAVLTIELADNCHAENSYPNGTNYMRDIKSTVTLRDVTTASSISINKSDSISVDSEAACESYQLP